MSQRFESRRTKGRVLSLSTWADDKAVIRWRTLAVHHEVQYLYFTYAMARRQLLSQEQENFPGNPQSEFRFAASFSVWPLIGLAGALSPGWYQIEWFAPFGVGGLFCHYWLDGRIWTRRSMAS